MTAIENALYFDICSVLFCAVLLVRHGRLAHSHPATIYLFFHIYTFTWRLLRLWSGGPTLFSTWGPQFEPVTYSEITRAAVLADLALIAMSIAWIRAAGRDTKKYGPRSDAAEEAPANLSLPHIWHVVAVAFPIGVVGLATLARLPGAEDPRVNFGEWQQSTWVSMTQAWVGLSLLALIYWYGFRWWLMSPMMMYLLIWAYQGYHRYRIIVPAILMAQMYLDQHGRKWPPVRIVVPFVALAIIFFPLKSIGRMAQAGASPGEIVANASEILSGAWTDTRADEVFLDQFASAMTLVDRNGNFYYGGTYLPLLANPIPRPLWPNKPGLADYIWAISRPWRPMGKSGMIVTFLGEAYANFGYVGIIGIAYLLAALLARAYFHAYRSNYFSVDRFAYLLLACNLIQVYRDGLVSIVIFTFAYMMPLTVIVLLHYFITVPKKLPPVFARDYRQKSTRSQYY